MDNSFRCTLLLLILSLALFFRDLDGKDLVSSHEARAAQDAQQMLDSGSFGLPRLYDGQADLQKPPGYYWIVAGLGAARGGTVDAYAVRLPAAIGATLTVLMVFFFLKRKQRPVAAFFSAAILASAIHFTGMGRVGRIDMPLTCAATAALLLMSSTSRWLQLCAAFPLCAGLLLKGPVGLVLPVTTWSVFCLVEKYFGSGQPRWFYPALSSILAIGMALPWYLWANESTGGEFFRVFFWYHNFQRATGGAAALGKHPWWLYFPRFAVDFLPWSPAFVLALWSCRRDRCLSRDPEARFGLIWFAAIFAVLSCSAFKRADYLIPAYPGAAIFLGCRLESRFLRLNPRRATWSLIGFFALLFGCTAGWWVFDRYVAPHQEAVREQRTFAEEIRRLAPAPQRILLFRVESHVLNYHLGRPVHTLVEWGELNDLLWEPGTHYIVTRAEFVPECMEYVKARRIEVVLRSEAFCREPPLRPLVLIRTVEKETSSCLSKNCPE
jgi:4-amino-4-deoxy-L-arabinose transferase-like glycosyltransferase